MKIFVRGGYQTRFGELWSKSLADLLFEAVDGALENAGVSESAIEAVFLANKMGGLLTNQNHLGALVSEYFARPVPVVRVEAACASGGVAVAQACQGLRAGGYRTVLVVGAEKMTDGSVEGTSWGLMSAAGEDERAAGLSFVGLYALMAARYLAEYEGRAEDLALPAVKNHQHASLNEKAQFPFPVTAEKVLESGLVADPLRLLECSPITDGASAVVLSTRRGSGRAVEMAASVQTGTCLSLARRETLTSLPATVEASKVAYAEAGLGPSDLSFVEVHDCFTISELLAVEDLGLYPRGMAKVAMRNGEVRLGGIRPINPSGGLKACGHPVGATGVRQIVELYLQLAGQAGQRQVEAARVGLAHNVGGTGGTVVIHILKAGV